MKPLGIRINDEAAGALEREALRRGVKPTTAARDLLIEALGGANTRTVEARLDAIEAALTRLERELPEALALAVAQIATGTAEERTLSSERRESEQESSLAAWVKSA